MGLLNAMTTLAEDWDDVQGRLEPGQAGRLRELVAQFGNETDTRASAKIAERVMDLLVEWLPTTDPVLRALTDPESRSPGETVQATDRAWAQLARSLRTRLAPSGPLFNEDDESGPPGTTFGDDDDS
jgi:hypothetical protein